MEQPIAFSAPQRSTSPPMPPGPSRKSAKVATLALLGIWLVVTFGAHSLAPWLGRKITEGEQALGLNETPSEETDKGSP